MDMKHLFEFPRDYVFFREVWIDYFDFAESVDNLFGYYCDDKENGRGECGRQCIACKYK
jgi:hypothetical protein